MCKTGCVLNVTAGVSLSRNDDAALFPIQQWIVVADAADHMTSSKNIFSDRGYILSICLWRLNAARATEVAWPTLNCVTIIK